MYDRGFYEKGKVMRGQTTGRKTTIGKGILVVGGVFPLLWIPLAVHVGWFWQFNTTCNRSCYAAELVELWFLSGVPMFSDWGSLIVLSSVILFLGSLLVIPYKWSWQVISGMLGSVIIAHIQALGGVGIVFVLVFVKVAVFGF